MFEPTYEVTNEKYDANPVGHYSWEEIVELVASWGESPHDLFENSSGVVFVRDEVLAERIED